MAVGIHFDSYGSLCALSWAYLLPRSFMLNWYSKYWKSFWSLMARISALNSLVRLIFVLLSPLLYDLVIPPPLDEVMLSLP